MAVICRLPQGGRAETQDINYLMLYDAGDECVDVTGGWEEYYTDNNGYTGPHTLTKNFDNITIKLNNYGYQFLRTRNNIDWSTYTKLAAKLDASVTNGGSVVIGYAPGTYKDIIVAVDRSESGTYSPIIDISNSNNNYLYLCNGAGGQNLTVISTLHWMALLREDTWQTWLIKAGLTVSSYANLDAVLADRTVLTTLMSSKAAVDYMLYHCTGTVMAAIIQSQDTLEAIADSPFNTRIFDNEHWNKFLRMAGVVPEAEKTYLYRYGNEYAETTGGWNSTYASSGGGSPNANIANGKAAQYLSTKATIISTSGGWAMAFYMAANRLDLSAYQVLCASVSVITGRCRCDISNINTPAASTVDNLIALGSADQSERIVRIDISNVTSGYLFAGSFLTPDIPSSEVRIFKVWLE